MDIQEIMDNNVVLHITDELLPSFGVMFNSINRLKYVKYIRIGIRILIIIYVLFRLLYLVVIKHR